MKILRLNLLEALKLGLVYLANNTSIIRGQLSGASFRDQSNTIQCRLQSSKIVFNEACWQEIRPYIHLNRFVSKLWREVSQVPLALKSGDQGEVRQSEDQDQEVRTNHVTRGSVIVRWWYPLPGSVGRGDLLLLQHRPLNGLKQRVKGVICNVPRIL